MRWLREEKGFTLLEVLVALTVFSMLSVALFYLVSAGYRSYWQELQRQEVEANLRSALDRITLRVRGAKEVVAVDPVDPKAPAKGFKSIKVTMPDGTARTYVFDPGSRELKEDGQPITAPVVKEAVFRVEGKAVSVVLTGEYLHSGELTLSTQACVKVGEQG
ncbi:PulJ/GspJ family protein [Ammonifex thiophilus]|uniref:Prepilin-type N-terminal cleavage/methylation domain-containing protein n=1 Tax=Ammonifex thiophilus TaxID=444093 RepID=A0A3D8P3C9_9THEO|nr:prepilin-type N-terminal cleavage/methylation domain-containing protein [Ammonifex thiophilus]RDV83221.1 prepilin-type N-terminal cleavage/methylation domain-containing protein [Ammonifex thiophilus]